MVLRGWFLRFGAKRRVQNVGFPAYPELMASNLNNNLPRCPKCNEPMRNVTVWPPQAQFVPWRTFTCDPCQVSVAYPPVGDNVDK